MNGILIDTIYPRDADHRYRLYAVLGDERRVLAAAPDAGSLGLMIVTLHEDAKTAGRRLADEGRIGVLDTMPGGKLSPTGEWVIQPYDRDPLRDPIPCTPHSVAKGRP